jgi:glycosyltransferase involved in cell wall biosynthesis
MARRIVLNGKFLMAAPTGVHRVAEEIILALDSLLANEAPARRRFDVELLVPRDVKRQLPLKAISTRSGGLFTWIPWEQFDLPARARGRTIVSLCNLGPVLTTHGVTMFHDAQVHISPESYSRPFRLWYKAIQPLLARRHRKILTVSAYSKQELVKARVAPADKIIVIHNGVDHILRQAPDPGVLDRLGLAPRGYVMALANTQHHKNVRILLQAFEDARLVATKLVLFGKASRGSLAGGLGRELPANVVTPGTISDAELAGLYANALCLGFPSLTEGFGLPPLEAMLLGCPAIVAPCGSLPEVCGDNALYAAPDQPGEWVDRILSLAAPEAHADWSARGREQAAAFTWRAAAGRLLEVLESTGPVQGEPIALPRREAA